ncbi:MAG: DUF692 family protein [Gammaproteobacteria bacterium]|nr:DUF692 family protein [Gammaproteobacteria bacterium]
MVGDDASQASQDIPLQRVREIHLAGYADHGCYLVDAHNNRVSEPVWQLFAQAMARLPDTPVLIEWVKQIPPLEVLLDGAVRAASFVATTREMAV